MAYHKECPNCGNCESGTTIHKCRDCGKKFCDDCQGEEETDLDGMIKSMTEIIGGYEICPGCGGSRIEEVCTIEEEDD